MDTVPSLPNSKAASHHHQSPHAHWQLLPMGSVQLLDGFWKTKQSVVRQASLEHAYRMLEDAGNFHNLRVAAGQEQGSYIGRNFIDSDIYKWLEAVGYQLSKVPSARLQEHADYAIRLVEAAQQPDGYLNSYYQVAEPGNRWTDMDHGHELYCAGHLFQAAVAYHRATGDARLLNVSTRFADHIDSVFGPTKRLATCGHPEVETALVELYRETQEKRYLALAQFFIDERGKGKMRGLGWSGPEYHQDRVPVRQADVIEGHAVRALYLLSGVTDLYLETGEQALYDSMLRQWQDLMQHKWHITGGVGARYEGESFGAAYELPNEQCYCETCAAIASVMWQWRMALATGEARFADILEQTLYNGVLSGFALDGTHFFYMNPLLSRGGYARQGWYEVACCPPNMMRTFSSVEQFIATTDEAGIQLHFYHSATVQTPRAALQIQTQYPWQGHIKITLTETDGAPLTLSLRVPGWATEATVTAKGQTVKATPGSYIHLDHVWQPGDSIEMVLDMSPQLIESHPLIDYNRQSVALRRGPFIYCLEQCDQVADADIMAVQLDEKSALRAEWEAGLLGGIMTIYAQGYALDTDSWSGQLYRPLSEAELPRHPIQLKAVPYYSWGNREAGAMRVWIPRNGR